MDKWGATDYVMIDGKKRYDIETPNDVIVMDVAEAEADLIVLAVNACIEVNPDHPEKVAEKIGEIKTQLTNANNMLARFLYMNDVTQAELELNVTNNNKLLSDMEDK